MKNLKELFFRYKEQILYLIFGGFTTVVNIAVYGFCTRIFHANEYFANFLAWAIAVFFAYVTNKLWVFESKSSDMKTLTREILSFVSARVVTLGLDMAVMYAGIQLLHINDLIVKVCSNVLVVLANYIFSKFFIFKKTK